MEGHPPILKRDVQVVNKPVRAAREVEVTAVDTHTHTHRGCRIVRWPPDGDEERCADAQRVQGLIVSLSSPFEAFFSPHRPEHILIVGSQTQAQGGLQDHQDLLQLLGGDGSGAIIELRPVRDGRHKGMGDKKSRVKALGIRSLYNIAS